MRCLRSLDLDTLGVATVEYMSSSDQHPAVLEGEVKSLATVFLPVVDGDIVPKVSYIMWEPDPPEKAI